MAMAYEELVDEDEYIDMEISSTAFCHCSVSSPPHSSQEFEFQFQLSAETPHRQSTTSPADELFYKGKLLPLHLPPRLQMVQKLLEHSYNKEDFNPFLEENVATTTGDDKTIALEGTPFESCNISPTTSCYVSGELNPEEFFHDWSSQLVQSNHKKSWSNKLKLIRQSSISHKLKASGAYLKSLFRRAGYLKEVIEKQKHRGYSCKDSAITNAFDQKQKEKNQTKDKVTDEECTHRRSLSGITKWNFRGKSSLSMPQVFKRSSSVKSEAETPIQGAIAYCKMSQQLISSRKSVSDIGFYSSTASRIAAACQNQEKLKLCRG